MTSAQFLPLTTSYPLSFHTVAASLPSFSGFWLLFSTTSGLFVQNTRGGGTPGNRSFGTLSPASVYDSVNAVVPGSRRCVLASPATHDPLPPTIRFPRP